MGAKTGRKRWNACTQVLLRELRQEAKLVRVAVAYEQEDTIGVALLEFDHQLDEAYGAVAFVSSITAKNKVAIIFENKLSF